MLIVANPPYKVANQVILKTVELAEQSVVLAPFGKYKKNNLYEYAEKTELADKCLFGDKAQDILPNLLICRLQSTRDSSRGLIDMEKPTWRKDFADYYEWNEKQPACFEERVYIPKDREFVESNLKRILFIPYWSHVGNAQSEKSVTKQANLGKEAFIQKILLSSQCYRYLIFDTVDERNNAHEFYCTDFCNELIWGCNTRGTSLKFPHVDWNRKWNVDQIRKIVLE